MECFWSRWGKFHCSACKKSNKRQKRNQQQGAFQKSLKYDWWTSCPSQRKRADQSSSPQVQPIFNNELKISIWKQERGFLSQLNPGWSSASFFRKDWLIDGYTLTRWFKLSFFSLLFFLCFHLEFGSSTRQLPVFVNTEHRFPPLSPQRMWLAGSPSDLLRAIQTRAFQDGATQFRSLNCKSITAAGKITIWSVIFTVRLKSVETCDWLAGKPGWWELCNVWSRHEGRSFSKSHYGCRLKACNDVQKCRKCSLFFLCHTGKHIMRRHVQDNETLGALKWRNCL